MFKTESKISISAISPLYGKFKFSGLLPIAVILNKLARVAPCVFGKLIPFLYSDVLVEVYIQKQQTLEQTLLEKLKLEYQRMTQETLQL